MLDENNLTTVILLDQILDSEITCLVKIIQSSKASLNSDSNHIIQSQMQGFYQVISLKTVC